MRGAELRVRPVVMTSLTAALGLLPAAMANSIGSQAQKPLAIVVVGGMLVTLFLTRYLMPVLYTFFPAPGTSSCRPIEQQGSLMIQTDQRAISAHEPSSTHATSLERRRVAEPARRRTSSLPPWVSARRWAVRKLVKLSRLAR